MRVRRGIGVACVLVGACMPLLEGKVDTPEEQGTYDTAPREDLPLPEGEGAAPFAGSLGPPLRMVDPVIIGTTTTTREGSAGPPVRVGAGTDGEVPEEEEEEPVRERRWLHGHDADAW